MKCCDKKYVMCVRACIKDREARVPNCWTKSQGELTMYPCVCDESRSILSCATCCRSASQARQRRYEKRPPSFIRKDHYSRKGTTGNRLHKRNSHELLPPLDCFHNWNNSETNLLNVHPFVHSDEENGKYLTKFQTFRRRRQGTRTRHKNYKAIGLT